MTVTQPADGGGTGTLEMDSVFISGGGSSGGGSGNGNSGGGTIAPYVAVRQPINGHITMTPAVPEAGDTVTVSVAVDDGYEIAGITVTERGEGRLAATDTGAGTYTFVYGGNPVVVAADIVPLVPGGGPGYINPYSDMEYLEISVPVTQEYVTFADEAEISDYAKNAVQLMNKLGIIKGVGENAVDPAGTATRAQAAAMLHRFILAAGE